MTIGLITGGAPHYEAGLVSGLVEQGVSCEVIGGDDLAGATIMRHPQVRFWNLQGGPQPGTSLPTKLFRVCRYYWHLMRLVARTGFPLIHVQWPYKLVHFDRTVLNLYYKLLGRKVVFTAHNVDTAARDNRQTWANLASLRFHYRSVDHIIVHTPAMKVELTQRFGVEPAKVSVIPHGIMSSVPETALAAAEARTRLGFQPADRVLLFFGLISPYKGLELLVQGMPRLTKSSHRYKLVIAGRIKECQSYWSTIEAMIDNLGLRADVITRLQHIPDEEVEVYLKAADLMVMPYRSIFQSGVIFLSYRFGLPVVATDVGSFREDVVEGQTGFICKPDDPEDLARTIDRYFASGLWSDPPRTRQQVREFAAERYSWSKIAKATRQVYEKVLAAS